MKRNDTNTTIYRKCAYSEAYSETPTVRVFIIDSCVTYAWYEHVYIMCVLLSQCPRLPFES